MKKRVSLFICLVLLLAVMTGCSSSAGNDARPDESGNGAIGVTDGVVPNTNGQTNDRINSSDSQSPSPSATDHPVTDQVETEMDHAGDAVRRGMENAGNAVDNAANSMTGR